MFTAAFLDFFQQFFQPMGLVNVTYKRSIRTVNDNRIFHSNSCYHMTIRLCNYDIVFTVKKMTFISYYNIIVFITTDKIHQSIKRAHIEPAAIQLYRIHLFRLFHNSIINAYFG